MCDLSPEALEPCIRFVRAKTGMHFDAANWLGLKMAVRERMRETKRTLASYVSLLEEDEKEILELFEKISVSETYFFRDRLQYRALRDSILPRLLEKRSSRDPRPRLKIVSCGCASGAEPYSIAIAAEEGGYFKEADVEIRTFDLNRKVIGQAARGVYTTHAFREPDSEFILKFFEKRGTEYHLKPVLKSRVRFEVGNLFDLDFLSAAVSGADVVFLKNVLIYFDEDSVLKVLRTIASRMAPDGFLFLGSAESLAWRPTGFAMEEIDGAFVWRPKGAAPLPSSPPRPVPSSIPMELFSWKPETAPDVRPFPPVPAPSVGDESHYENGAGYLQLKNFESAEKEFQDQLRSHPNHLKSLLALARLYADSGRDAAALQAAERALRLDNLLGEAYFILGLVRYQRREFPQAIEQFRKALYCDERHFLTHFYLALALREFGKGDDARREFQNTIAAIRAAKAENLPQAGGYTGSYVLSYCMDSIAV